MFDAGLLSVLVAYVTWAGWRALRGPAPLRPIRLSALAMGCVAIHLGFHAAATAAPSPTSAIGLVLAGWTTFGLWWKWLTRAPAAHRRGGPDESDEGGGGPGDGPPPTDPRGPSGDDVDWEAFEREFAAYVERGGERSGERSGDRPLAPD